jgi:hypothetical protein
VPEPAATPVPAPADAAAAFARRRRLTLLAQFAALAAAVLSTSLLADRFDARRRGEAPERVLYLPKGDTLKYMCLGYRGVAADLVWIRSVMYVGRRVVRREQRFEWMEKLYLVTTDLDPHWTRPYNTGAILLSALPQDDQRAMGLLRRGLERNGWSWEIPYQAAQLSLLRGRNREGAAYLRLISRTMSGYPKVVESTLSRVKLEGNDYRAAVSTAADGLTRHRDSVIREITSRNYREALARLLEQELSGAAAHYRAVQGRPPESVRELLRLPAVRLPGGRPLPAVREHLLVRMTNTLRGDAGTAGRIVSRLPADPFGMEYYLRPDGSVHSRGLERLEAIRLAASLNAHLKQFLRDRGRPPADPAEFLAHLESASLPPGAAQLFGNPRRTPYRPARLPPHPLGPDGWTAPSAYSWRSMLNPRSGLLETPRGPESLEMYAAPLDMPGEPAPAGKR